MAEQKFHRGDLVHIAADLGSSMRHFTADKDAIVLYSYAERYGGGEPKSHDYSIWIKGRGPVSWYYEHQLTLLEAGREDLLKEWEDAAEETRKRVSDLDWIFANGATVADNPHGASLEALGKTLGVDNLWGARGEGITYYTNCATILALATPFLRSGDKDGWLAFAASHAKRAPE